MSLVQFGLVEFFRCRNLSNKQKQKFYFLRPYNYVLAKTRTMIAMYGVQRFLNREYILEIADMEKAGDGWNEHLLCQKPFSGTYKEALREIRSVADLELKARRLTRDSRSTIRMANGKAFCRFPSMVVNTTDIP